jgi:hypothetical protein
MQWDCRQPFKSLGLNGGWPEETGMTEKPDSPGALLRKMLF